LRDCPKTLTGKVQRKRRFWCAARNHGRLYGAFFGRPAMLEKHLILWPMAALAALTFIVLNLMPFSRVVAMRSGKARVSDFR
jgi:hypothetical protein